MKKVLHLPSDSRTVTINGTHYVVNEENVFALGPDGLVMEFRREGGYFPMFGMPVPSVESFRIVQTADLVWPLQTATGRYTITDRSAILRLLVHAGRFAQDTVDETAPSRGAAHQC